MYWNKKIIYERYAFRSQKEPLGDRLTVRPCEFHPEVELPRRGITVKNLYLLFDDHYVRGRYPFSGVSNIEYMPWANGEEAIVKSISKVLRSDSLSFRPGDLVLGFAPASRYASIPSWLLDTSQVLPPTGPDVPLRTIIDVLGTQGLSAYANFSERIPKPRSDMTVFVSAAYGVVGQVIGMLAKKHGMTILGSASGNEKSTRLITELDYNGTWDSNIWTATGGLTSVSLSGIPIHGIDIYFDNVGGELGTVLSWMNDGGIIFSDLWVSGSKTKTRIKNEKGSNITIYPSIPANSPTLAQHMFGYTRDMVAWIGQRSITPTGEVVESMEAVAVYWSEMMKQNGIDPKKLVLQVS